MTFDLDIHAGSIQVKLEGHGMKKVVGATSNEGLSSFVGVPHLDFVKLSEDLFRTRCNKYKLAQHHCHYELRKFNYTNRVIPMRNSLSNHVVSTENLNTFRNRLAKLGGSTVRL